MTRHVVVALLSFVPLAAVAQVPTFRDIVGHDFGERITYHHEMVRYLERLAEASPRVTIEQQGTSWEGRTFAIPNLTGTNKDNSAWRYIFGYRFEDITTAAPQMSTT